MSPFLFVLPSGNAAHPAVQKWVEFESQHQIDRWRALMRGEPRVKRDVDVTEEDIRKYNLVLWGDPSSNQLIKRVLEKNVIGWDEDYIAVAPKKYPSLNHVLVAVRPNPLNAAKYVVFNSGLTFRESHDRTNSLQNPKLPDWAIIDVTVPPDGNSPGKVVDADFFDESWQVKKR